MPKLSELPGILKDAINDLNSRDIAVTIGKKLNQEFMPENRYSGRLRNSGSLYVDGVFEGFSRDPRGFIDYRKSRHLGRRRAPRPHLDIVPGKSIHQINIQYYTPVPWKGGIYDYAEKIMGTTTKETQYRFGSNQAGRWFNEVIEQRLRRRLK